MHPMLASLGAPFFPQLYSTNRKLLLPRRGPVPRFQAGDFKYTKYYLTQPPPACRPTSLAVRVRLRAAACKNFPHKLRSVECGDRGTGCAYYRNARPELLETIFFFGQPSGQVSEPNQGQRTSANRIRASVCEPRATHPSREPKVKRRQLERVKTALKAAASQREV